MTSKPITNQDHADRTFLALCLWREARGENRLTRIGVAMAVMNRVNRPSWWGKNLTEVLFKKWQFSSLTDPNDRQLTTWPLPNDLSWQECLDLACQVIDKAVPNSVPGADSYFDISIPADQWPKWTATARFVCQLGRIRFYDVDHDYEAKPVAN
jgi:N-acetylmuramoyl-L-alanine amidase